MASNSAEIPRLFSLMSLGIEKTLRRLIGPVEITTSIGLENLLNNKHILYSG